MDIDMQGLGFRVSTLSRGGYFADAIREFYRG